DAGHARRAHPRLGAAHPEGLGARAFIAEPPIDDPGDDRRNVARLWELAGLEGPKADSSFSMLTPALKKKMVKLKASGRVRGTSSRRKSSGKKKAKKPKASR